MTLDDFFGSLKRLKHNNFLISRDYGSHGLKGSIRFPNNQSINLLSTLLNILSYLSRSSKTKFTRKFFASRDYCSQS
ncbi:CLUMA_CG015660, isoform A [Clunio marinus]|uniref:CLUMA_CG015660, isoform A n=1 Tax=Clunio marinus TaxID=568069 RepID=A0A1J1IUW9_9DIPT|nr:CLUMA_CG015660, isoform A [Clunio marinus]